ncbi:MAG: hypothetical protein ACLTBV_13830 [Enterocloster bolteae]
MHITLLGLAEEASKALNGFLPISILREKSVCFFVKCGHQVRDILSRSPAMGRGTGRLSYTPCLLTKPVLRLRLTPRNHSPVFLPLQMPLALPGGNGIFRGNADRAYNTLHFASKVVCQGASPLETLTTKQAEYLALSQVLDTQPLFVVSSPRFVVCV